jgi:acyl-CoA thioesterase I
MLNRRKEHQPHGLAVSRRRAQIMAHQQRQPHVNDRQMRPGRVHSRAGLLLVIVTIAALLAGCGQLSTSVSTASMRAQHTITYVAIGASDAFGIGTDDPDRDNWPTALSHLMGQNVHLINLGIPGETVAEARRTELPIALDARPAIVTVWLGVNDIAQAVTIQEYKRQLEALLQSLRQNTQARIFVGNIPDLLLLPFFAGYNQPALQETISEWNTAISQAVSAAGASLVDLYASWSELATHPEYIASDGLHPSTEGAKRLAAVFWSQIALVFPALRATTP